MTKRQKLLLDYHLDIANLAANPEYPVFFVLDLEDDDGFALAESMFRDRERVIKAKNAISSTNCIPALTAVMKLDDANRLLDWWNKDNLPPKNRYIAIVSDDSITVCGIPEFS